MLNDFQAAMLKARGFDFRFVEPVDPLNERAGYVATVSKTVGSYRVQALGNSEADAIAKVIGVVVRP